MGVLTQMAEFQQYLLSSLPPERQSVFSCGHIVPADHILGTVVGTGPKGHALEFTHANWQQTAMLDELALALSNYVNLIPHGMVVFFPSYTSLDATLARWKETGALHRLGAKKRVFVEPKQAQQVESVLQQYAEAVAVPSPTSPRGAMLLAVVGAKLSEGINFQDDLARCVAMVGLPFPNAKSPELAERMAFVRTHAPPGTQDRGRELYLNLCMRAVNQSMGRAIRHQNDYAVFLMLDQRYARSEIQARLPAWIRDRVHVADKFARSIQAIAAFFRDKKKTTAVAPT